jgi:ABC-2 type transport system permease protein
MNARTVLAIARKDILDAIKNRYLLMSMILPIGLSVLFQLVFGGIANAGSMRMAVYDPGSSRLAAQLRAIKGVNVVEVESVEAVQKEAEGSAFGGIFIPEDFDQDVDLGKQPELTVYLNRGMGSQGLAAFQQILSQQVWSLREDAAPARITFAETDAQPEAEGAEGGLKTEGFRMDSYLLVMFLVMSLTMTGSFVVPLLLVEEKEKHTMEFLLVSPVTPAEIAAGKALTGLAYSSLSAGVLIALNKGWTGDWGLTILALILGAMFLVTVGLLMGSLLHTMMQINTWSTIVMMILLAPSWLSVIKLPGILDAIVRAVPTYYLVNILEQSLAGRATLQDSAVALAVIAAGGVVSFALVVLVLRRQET